MSDPTDRAAQLVRHVADLQRRVTNLEALARDDATALAICGGLLSRSVRRTAETIGMPDVEGEDQ